MAKKKIVDSGKTADSRSDQSTKKSVAKKSLKPAAISPSLRSLTSDEIGEVAGEIWQLLTDENDHTLASIKKTIAAPDVLVMAGIGWLARENKLQFTTRGRTTKVSLR